LRDEIFGERNFEEIVGQSATWQRLMQQLEAVASSDSTVLIRGETGVGKELVARALHIRSRRRARPLVKINCGAISAGLVDSELFGHVKGAFTGASQQRTGRFELAHEGTLFLDEVGELPLDTQVRLLRVLQEREFERVGSSEPVSVDVRVVAATNRDLELAVQDGRFRADLYYRLNVIPLHVPPLRERQQDIAELALHFLARSARRVGRPVQGIASAALDWLTSYSWPGNVRELENVIERAVVLSSGPSLELEALVSEAAPARISVSSSATLSASAASAPAGSAAGPDETLTLEEIERRHIRAVLDAAGWVIEGPRGAAQRLNSSPSTIRSRMKKLGIARAAGR